MRNDNLDVIQQFHTGTGTQCNNGSLFISQATLLEEAGWLAGCLPSEAEQSKLEAHDKLTQWIFLVKNHHVSFCNCVGFATNVAATTPLN